MFKRTALFLTVLLLPFVGISFVQAEPASDFASQQDPVHAELLVEQETAQAGRPFWVGVRLSLDDKWHAYWKNPGDAGMAPMIKWHLPEGYGVTELLWPTPKKFTLNDTVSFGYENEAFLLAKIKAPESASGNAQISANIRWVVCDDSSCLPGGAEVKASVPISESTPVVTPAKKALFSEARAKMPVASEKFKASASDGLVTIRLDSQEEIAEALFFPENLDRIDHTADAILTKADKKKGQYHLILREAEGASKTEPVKGIVLIKTIKEKEFTFAYQVDLPVVSPIATDIAFASPDVTGSDTEYAMGAHDFKGGFLLALGLAFVGGLLLNLMPCVLPVISFKVLSFVKMAGQSRSLIFKHSLFFSLGVLFSFWTLAGVLLAMQAYGHSVGWGFQLQEPLFVAALASIILVFSLSMFGVFEIGTGFATMAGQAQIPNKNSGLKGSFFSGVLATAVATPCTGPFLGTAVGFAVTLPAAMGMLIFTSLALGMALPYLLLGAFPQLLRFLPKPGNWMVTFKEIMGFVMMATVLWLVWVFGAQTGALAVFFLLSGFLSMAVACWVFGKWGSPINKKTTRNISFAATLVFFCLGGYAIFLASTIPFYHLDDMAEDTAIGMNDGHHHNRWEPFSPKRVEELRKQGVPVFVDFTAKWCLICQANHLVLTVDDVEKKFNELGVVRMKADWTRSNPVITEELKKYGRNSVPLYLLYQANSNQPAEILPQVLTPEIVMEYLDKLNG